MLVDFHGIYERYSQDVYRFACFLSGNPSLAEEIAQETFVRAWITPGLIRVGTVKAYLFMIARNLYRAEIKRQARHVALDEATLDPRTDGQSTSDARFELDDVFRSLQTLPEVDRAALLMYVQDEMPYAEIAEALGLSLGVVKARIHRAGIRLKTLQKRK